MSSLQKVKQVCQMEKQTPSTSCHFDADVVINVLVATQGSHTVWKTSKFEKSFSAGKSRESRYFGSNSGKVVGE